MRDGKEALRQLAVTVDHTVLKLDATSTAIDGLCSEARTEGFKVSLCVSISWLKGYHYISPQIPLRRSHIY
jgi:deoxyribose-phosphate aldolase